MHLSQVPEAPNCLSAQLDSQALYRKPSLTPPGPVRTYLMHLVQTLIPHLQPFHHLHLDLGELDALNLEGISPKVRSSGRPPDLGQGSEDSTAGQSLLGVRMASVPPPCLLPLPLLSED